MPSFNPIDFEPEQILKTKPAGVPVIPNTETSKKENPVFEVKALGSFKQKPGCPDYKLGNLSSEKIKTLCKNECYNPSEQRNIINRIEVIKITPQNSNNEEIDKLIMDPWKTIDCPKEGNGCRVRFSDDDYSSDKRDSVYYVRAIEEPSLRINAGNLRCDFDEQGCLLYTSPSPRD